MNRLLCMCMSAVTIAVAAPLRITVDGKPNANIVVPENLREQPTVKLAVKELVYWVREISGAQLPASEAPVTIAFSLGAEDFPEDAAALAGTDGYAVRTRGQRLTIVAVQPRGLLNAVHKLLFKNTDIIWARPDAFFGTVFSHNPDITFAVNDYRDIPVFRQRGWQIEVGNRKNFMAEYQANELWQVRNGSNWSTANEADKIRYDYILEYGGGHNLTKLFIHPDKYWATHPEFFSQLGGKLTDPRKYNASTQLCFTNPQLLEAFKQELEEKIQKNPQYTVYRVMIEDNYHMCECPNCLKDITLADGTVLKGDAPRESPEWKIHRNTQFFTWYNELARYMKERHPGKRLLSFAYFFTEPAPLIPLEDNIDISFCPIYKDSRGSVLDARNKDVLDKITKWLRVTPNVTWREYYGLNVEFPRPIDAVAFADYKYIHDHGMTKTYSELVCDFNKMKRWRGDVVWDFSAPYLWNLTNAVWNPEQDYQALRDVFFTRCYGKASETVRRIYDITEAAWADNKVKSQWNDKAVGLWALICRHPDKVRQINALLEDALVLCDKPNGRRMLERYKEAFTEFTYISDVRLKAAKVDAPPPFEPTLTQGPWKDAPAYTEFHECPYRTTVKLLHDGKNLYAAMRAEHPGVKKLFDEKITYTQHEAFNFFFEILDPNTNEPSGYHFLDDALGRTWASLVGNKKLPIPWKHQEILEDDSWTILFTMPLEPMTKPLKAAFFRRHIQGDDIWPNYGYGLRGTAMHCYYSFLPLDLE